MPERLQEQNKWKVMGSRSLLSWFNIRFSAFNLHPKLKKPFSFLLTMYHSPQTQEWVIHPWYNLSTQRHHFGASSPGILRKHCCVMGDPSLSSHIHLLHILSLLAASKREQHGVNIRGNPRLNFKSRLVSYCLSKRSIFQQKQAPHFKYTGAQKACWMSCENVYLWEVWVLYYVGENLHT